MLEKYILTNDQVDRISQFGVDSIMLCCYLDVLENVINSGEDAEFLQDNINELDHLNNFVRIAKRENIDVSRLAINLSSALPELIERDEVDNLLDVPTEV